MMGNTYTKEDFREALLKEFSMSKVPRMFRKKVEDQMEVVIDFVFSEYIVTPKE